MLKRISLAVFLVSAATAGAQAQTSISVSPASSQAPPAASAPDAGKSTNKSDVNRVVCQKQEKTGSRVGAHKVCMTVAQWDAYQKDVQDQLIRFQQSEGIASH
jgi:hypothetical protein